METPKRLTIVQVISSNKCYGAEKVVLQLCSGFKAKGHNVVLALMDNFNEENEVELLAKQLGISVKRIVVNRQLDLKAIRDLGSFIAKETPEIIHTHNYKSNFYVLCILPFFLRKLHECKWVSTVHGWNSPTFKSFIYESLDMLFVRNADRIIAVSTDLLKKFSLLLIPPSKSVYIPNGIEVNSAGAEKFPRQLDDIFTVAFIGRMEREKNFKRLIKALLLYFKDSPYRNKTQVVLAGTGSLYNWAKGKISTAGLASKKIKFLGKVLGSNMKELYKSVDCLLLPSLKEGLPMVVLEAMSWGIPIVGTDVAVKEVRYGGKVDFIFEVGYRDEKLWVEVLSKIAMYYFERREYYVSICHKALKQVRMFDRNLMVERYLDLYYNILKYD